MTTHITRRGTARSLDHREHRSTCRRSLGSRRCDHTYPIDRTENRLHSGALLDVPISDVPCDMPCSGLEDACDVMLEEDELDLLTQRFRDDRMQSGPSEAVRSWVDEPFAEWMHVLDDTVGTICDECECGYVDASIDVDTDDDDIIVDDCSCANRDCVAPDCMMLCRKSMAAFAVGMNELLPVRDAVIVSLVNPRACDRHGMVTFAAQPHASRTQCGMSQIMSDAFHNPHVRPDAQRCAIGVAMLDQIADSVPPRWRVQPMAAAAYVLWWLNDDLAVLRAAECLTIDDQCSLGAIVLSMLDRGICPAWCDR